MSTFRHPLSGRTESVGPAWLWALLFGAFYFAYKGIWTHAIIGFVLAFLTLGVSWIAYAILAPGIVRKSYLQRGWVSVT